MVSLFYPPHGPVEAYCNNAEAFQQAIATQSTVITPALSARLHATGRIPKAGDVKYVFVTKSGPGPLLQPLSECLLDPSSGEPVEAGPKHKRMKIGE